MPHSLSIARSSPCSPFNTASWRDAAFKERWTQIVRWAIERSTYVLCASLALLLLFWQWRPIGIQIWSVETPAARVVLWTLCAAGWATVLTVTFLINHFDLFGLRQVWLPLIGEPYTRVSFRTPLPHRFVRHPLDFGFLLAWKDNPSGRFVNWHPRCRATDSLRKTTRGHLIIVRSVRLQVDRDGSG